MGGIRVSLIGSGEAFQCDDHETLLAGMRRRGARCIPAGCLGGCCGVCRVKVHAGRWRASGPMSRVEVSAEDERSGVLLACRTIPLCDIDVEVLGKRIPGMR